MMKLPRIFLAMGAVCAVLSSPLAQDSKSAPGAKAYIINLKSGDSVKSPFTVRFGLSGMGVTPAGLQGEATANTGHHHLLIDTKLEGDALKQPIPSDARHMHFGKGQTETVLTLAPGKHTLQLVLGDWTHIPHVPPVMSEPVTITVK